MLPRLWLLVGSKGPTDRQTMSVIELSWTAKKKFTSKKNKMLAFELIKKQCNRYLRPKHQDKNYTLLKIFHNHDWQHDKHEELTVDLFLAFEEIVDRAGGPDFHSSHLVFLHLTLSQIRGIHKTHAGWPHIPLHILCFVDDWRRFLEGRKMQQRGWGLASSFSNVWSCAVLLRPLLCVWPYQLWEMPGIHTEYMHLLLFLGRK